MPKKMEGGKEFNEAIGRRIRARRVSLGMSQKELADKVEISFQQAHKYEHGDNALSPARLVQLSRVLHIPVAALLGIENSAEDKQKSDRIDLEQARSFANIEDPEVRQNLLALTKSLARKTKK